MAEDWPTGMPCLLLAENNKDNLNRIRKIFNLINNKCYNFSLPETFGARCLGSVYGWVALVQRDLTLQLFNPITKAQILYPSLEPLIPYLSPIFDKNNEEDIIWFLTAIVLKLVVIKVPRGDHEEFVIVASNSNCLFYARLGDQSWTVVLHDVICLQIADIVAMDDHVFAMFNNGAIIHWNVVEFYGPEAVKPSEYCPGKADHILPYAIDKMYLVQCGSDLLMVLRYKEACDNDECKTIDFKVSRLDAKNKSWEKIEDLGNVALFIGNNSSTSISEASAKGLQCAIYFTDDDFECWSLPKEFGGHDMSVYDFKSRKILPFYEGDDTRSLFCPSTWFMT